jgi:hypothetical protein
MDNIIGLNYYNPQGGVKHCLNTKIAKCEIQLSAPNDPKKAPVKLTTDYRLHEDHPLSRYAFRKNIPF